MRNHVKAVLFAVLLALAVPVWARTLPDACGSDAIKFDVSTPDGPALPAGPAAGKARIVFVEDNNQMTSFFSYPTARYGIDGAWVGANRHNSYFAVDVTPGLHHLCGNWQGTGYFDLAPLTAEPDKVYYFAVQVMIVGKESVTFAFVQLNDDQVKYRMKTTDTWKVAASKQRQEQP